MNKGWYNIALVIVLLISLMTALAGIEYLGTIILILIASGVIGGALSYILITGIDSILKGRRNE